MSNPTQSRQASNLPKDEPIHFNAILHPYRSLGRRGFALLMASLGGVFFLISLYFYHLGAWPIVGFAGLDLLLLYWAFRTNYRDARAYEQIIITERSLQIIKTSAGGEQQSMAFNPYWVRLESKSLEDEGMTELALVSHGERVEIGPFLHAADRQSLANALQRALADSKRPSTRTQWDK